MKNEGKNKLIDETEQMTKHVREPNVGVLKIDEWVSTKMVNEEKLIAIWWQAYMQQMNWKPFEKLWDILYSSYVQRKDLMQSFGFSYRVQ